MMQMNPPFISKTTALHEHHIMLVSTLLRRSLHDFHVKRLNATFCGGPRTHGDELLVLAPDDVLGIQIQELGDFFYFFKNLENAT